MGASKILRSHQEAGFRTVAQHSDLQARDVVDRHGRGPLGEVQQSSDDVLDGALRHLRGGRGNDLCTGSVQVGLGQLSPHGVHEPGRHHLRDQLEAVHLARGEGALSADEDHVDGDDLGSPPDRDCGHRAIPGRVTRLEVRTRNAVVRGQDHGGTRLQDLAGDTLVEGKTLTEAARGTDLGDLGVVASLDVDE